MRLVATIAAVFVATFILAMDSPKAHAEAAETKQEEPIKVIVQKGDSLSKLAKEHETTYQRLFFANESIKHPDLIYPDQELRVPNDDEELQERTLPADAVVPVEPERKTSAKTTTRANTGQSHAANQVVHGGVWDRLAACESGGNWSINTGNGYYGGLQFSLPTWRSVGGTGYPHQASKSEQIARAKILQARSGWGQWPACTAKLGLR